MRKVVGTRLASLASALGDGADTPTPLDWVISAIA